MAVSRITVDKRYHGKIQQWDSDDGHIQPGSLSGFFFILYFECFLDKGSPINENWLTSQLSPFCAEFALLNER